MLEFKLNVDERKTLAQRMEELTGIHSCYTRAPLYAYEIGSYTISRSGSLLVEEDAADRGLLQTLFAEGLIQRDVTGWLETSDERGQEISEEPQTVEDSESEAVVDEEETTMEETTMEETTMEETTMEETTMEETNSAELPSEGTADNAGNNDLALVIDLPLTRHTGVSLRNLLHIIYVRGDLLQKATGGTFYVDEGLINVIRDDSCTCSVGLFLRTVQEYEEQNGPAMRGIELSMEGIKITGFPMTEDADRLTMYNQLAALINLQAIMQVRIHTKRVEIVNERYAMRIWLMRLGMEGDEYKPSRDLLMERLSGNTAFRTPDQAERAKEKAAQKRRERQAAARAVREALTVGA